MKTRRHRGHAQGFAVAVLLVGALVLEGNAGADEIRTSVPFPSRDHPVIISVLTPPGLPAPSAEVAAVYRPGSEVECRETVGLTDSLGQVLWTPRLPGIASLTAGWSDSAGLHCPASNVSIRFSRVRIDGVLVAAAAGLILYGSVVFGFLRMRS